MSGGPVEASQEPNAVFEDENGNDQSSGHSTPTLVIDQPSGSVDFCCFN